MKNLLFLVFIFSICITAAPAQTYILNEDFTSGDGSKPPLGWTNSTVNGTSSDLWRFDNPGLREFAFPISGKAAIFDSEFYSGTGEAEKVYLESPAFDASFGSNIFISFDHFFAGGRNGKGTVEVFNGSDWLPLQVYQDSTTNPEKALLNASAMLGGITNAKIRFLWEGDSSLYWIIDNIRVYSPLNHDAGIIKIDHPQMYFSAGNHPVKISIGNFGAVNLSSTTIKWSVNGVIQPEVLWQGNLAPGLVSQNVEIGNYHFFGGKEARIKVWQENPNGTTDFNKLNDTLTTSLYAMLCGTYTIGGNSPYFSSINEALNGLQKGGINCNVNFKIRDGNYVQNLTINKIHGTSGSKKIVFESESGDSTKVNLVSNSGNVLHLRNTNHIEFRKIGFLGAAYTAVIVIAENSNSIVFGNCSIRQGNRSIELSSFSNVKIEHSLIDSKIIQTPSDQGDSLIITGNTIAFSAAGTVNQRSGVSLSKVSNCLIMNNNFTASGIYIDSLNNNSGVIEGNKLKNACQIFGNFKIIKNKINVNNQIGIIAVGKPGIPTEIRDNIIETSSTGIRAQGNVSAITGNQLLQMKDAGLEVFSSNTLIANNFVKLAGSNISHGIRTGSTAFGLKILFNTIHNQGNNHYSSALLLKNGNAVTVKNNIFSCLNGFPIYLDTVLNNQQWDYNNYFSPADKVGYYNKTAYTNFNSWKNAIQGDSASLLLNPFFSNNPGYKVNNPFLNNKGILEPEVTQDIEGKTRSTTPDIGAFEFDSILTDAGIDKIIQPFDDFAPGTHPIIVQLVNYGTTPLTQASIQWSMNGNPQGTFNWTGNLASLQKTSVNLGNFNFPNQLIHTISSWTSMPNGIADPRPANDTASKKYIVGSFCGEYTIGGANADFSGFNDAISSLMRVGVSCPVTFKVRNGVYQEELYFTLIPGVSKVNTVTFRSEQSDSSKVSLVANSELNKTLVFDNSKHLIFQHLTFENIANESTVHFQNSNDSMMFESCRFLNKGKCISIHSTFSSIKITNCEIVGNVVKTNQEPGHGFALINSVIKKVTYWSSSGLSLNNVLNAEIQGNTIPREIHITGNQNSGNISGNSCDFILAEGNFKIFDNFIWSANPYGIALTSDNPSSTIEKNALYGNKGILVNGKISSVSNNKINVNEDGIVINSTGTTVGNNYVSIKQGTGIKTGQVASAIALYYNTVISNDKTKKSNSLLEVNNSNISVINNILSGLSTSYPVIIKGGLTGLNFTHNNYYEPTGKIALHNGTEVSSLAQWKTLMPNDTLSLNVNPYFSTASGYKPNHNKLNNAGIEISEITHDINDTLRGLNPDLGVVEFDAVPNDAGISKILNPKHPLTIGNQNIRIELTNYGTQPLTKADIHWSVNGIAQTPFKWTGNLAQFSTLDSTIGNFNFIAGRNYHLKVWTANPNGVADLVTGNDTSVVENLANMNVLCGTYSIGGENPDYANFHEAVDALTKGGVSCPVVFKVRDGEYPGFIEIGPITGASEINQITFEGQSKDSSKVTIATAVDDYDSYYGINFNGSKHINIKYIGIKNWNSGIQISDNSSYIKFENLHTYNDEYSNYSMHFSGESSNIMIKNCRLLSEIHGFGSTSNLKLSNNYIFAYYHEAPFMSNIEIKDNVIFGDFRSWDLSYSESTNIFENNVFHGQLSSYRNSKTIIKNNRFINHNNYATLPVQGNPLIIINNTIKGGSIGIEVLGKIDTIAGNKIFNVSNTGVLFNSSGTVFHNNFIHVKGTGSAVGVDIGALGADVQFYHNTINNTSTHADAKSVVVKNGKIDFRNNILSNAAGIPVEISGTLSNQIWDYNNIFSSDGTIGSYNGSTYSSLPAWGAAIGGDANSKTLNPYFAHDTHYVVHQTGLNGAGININNFNLDIEGKLRNNQAPDMGAYEFLADFGLTDLINPSLDCHKDAEENIKVKIRQFGDIPFQNIHIAHSINDGIIYYDTITGTIQNDIDFTFTQTHDLSAEGEYKIKVWLVNNTDDNINNDTLSVTRYSKPRPTVDFNYITTCAGEATPFSGNASVSNGFISEYEWLFGDGTNGNSAITAHTYETSGSYMVTLRAYSNQGCYGEVSKEVVLKSTPIADFTYQNGCASDSLLFNNLTLNTGSLNYRWYSNNTQISNLRNLKHSFPESQSYTISLVSINELGCKDSISKEIQIYPKPSVEIQLDGNQAISIPQGGTAPYEYYWSNHKISPIINDIEYGVHSIVITDKNGCMATDSVGYWPNRAPVALNDTVSTYSAVSTNIHVVNNDNDPDGDSIIVSLLDLPVNGQVVLSGNHFIYTSLNNYSGADQFLYTACDAQGQCDSATVVINVLPCYQPEFISFAGPTMVCAEDVSQYQILFSATTEYKWTITKGDITHQSENTVGIKWENMGYYDTLVIKASNPCGLFAVKNIPVHINSVPVQPTGIIGDEIVCPHAGDINYAIEIAEGAHYYTWTVPPGASITDGDSSNAVFVKFGRTSGEISVSAVNQCGSSLLTKKEVVVDLMPECITSAKLNNIIPQTQIYATGHTIQIKLMGYESNQVEVIVSDILGRKIAQKNIGRSGGQIKLSDSVSDGIYIIKLRSKEGYINKKIVIGY